MRGKGLAAIMAIILVILASYSVVSPVLHSNGQGLLVAEADAGAGADDGDDLNGSIFV